ncbi:ABC transporter permease [Bacillus salitolerans]|uniref:Transport permease protein n=1 Tax=Bacillus salitolerans TaxID=1437434 RepID=A0ABW4LQR7_9BACI
MILAKSLLHTILVHMKLSIARPMFKFIIWISPLFFSTIAIFIYGTDSAETLFHYVVLGSGFMALWSSIVFSSASDVNRERFYGTLEIIFISPIPFASTLIGKIIANTLWGLISMILSFIYLKIVFQLDLVFYHPWLFVIALVFVLLALSVFSFFLALVFTLSRQAEALMNFIEYPIYLVCGFLFPISYLPNWVQGISYILPPTWAIQLLRDVTTESLSLQSVTISFTAIILLTLLYIFIGIFCYQLMDKKARTSGKLGVY